MTRRLHGLRPGSMLLGSALLVLTLTGCSVATRGGGGGESGAGSGDLAEVKRRVVELQEQARMSEIEIARLRKKVADLEARLGITSPAPTSRPASPASPSVPSTPPRTEPEPIREPRREPRRDATPRDEAPMLEEIDLEDEDLPADPPNRPSTGPTTQPTTPATRPSGSSTTTPVTPEAQELYDQGYTLYHRGRYLDAEASFQQFLRGHGSNDLADNAQYWIGEARYARGDLNGALSAFRETVERYPRGNKVPDALVKAGQVLEALGDPEGARETYTEVMRRFAEAPAAAVARDRLNQLP